MTWISLKVWGFVHLGVPCTMVVLECSKEQWLVKTSPRDVAPVLSECPWPTSTEGPLAWQWAKPTPPETPQNTEI